jgi:hypothetical protein
MMVWSPPKLVYITRSGWRFRRNIQWIMWQLIVYATKLCNGSPNGKQATHIRFYIARTKAMLRSRKINISWLSSLLKFAIESLNHKSKNHQHSKTFLVEFALCSFLTQKVLKIIVSVISILPFYLFIYILMILTYIF